MKKLVEVYEKYTGRGVKFQETPEAPGTTLSNSDLEEPYNIDKYRPFVGQLMWYMTKVVPVVENAAGELAVHMSHHGTEYWKALVSLIGCLKGKESLRF